MIRTIQALTFGIYSDGNTSIKNVQLNANKCPTQAKPEVYKVTPYSDNTLLSSLYYVCLKMEL